MTSLPASALSTSPVFSTARRVKAPLWSSGWSSGTSLPLPGKACSDVLDYSIDWSSWLQDGQDALAAFHVTASGCRVLWWQARGALGVFAVAGGSPGVASVTTTATFHDGRRHTLLFRLPLTPGDAALCTPPLWRVPSGACVPPNTLSETGHILTLPDGSPLTL